eukprot:1184356-Prorocentrum_minimum.AAC.4
MARADLFHRLLTLKRLMDSKLPNDNPPKVNGKEILTKLHNPRVSSSKLFATSATASTTAVTTQRYQMVGKMLWRRRILFADCQSTTYKQAVQQLFVRCQNLCRCRMSLMIHSACYNTAAVFIWFSFAQACYSAQSAYSGCRRSSFNETLHSANHLGQFRLFFRRLWDAFQPVSGPLAFVFGGPLARFIPGPVAFWFFIRSPVASRGDTDRMHR